MHQRLLERSSAAPGVLPPSLVHVQLGWIPDGSGTPFLHLTNLRSLSFHAAVTSTLLSPNAWVRRQLGTMQDLTDLTALTTIQFSWPLAILKLQLPELYVFAEACARFPGFRMPVEVWVPLSLAKVPGRKGKKVLQEASSADLAAAQAVEQAGARVRWLDLRAGCAWVLYD